MHYVVCLTSFQKNHTSNSYDGKGGQIPPLPGKGCMIKLVSRAVLFPWPRRWSSGGGTPGTLTRKVGTWNEMIYQLFEKRLAVIKIPIYLPVDKNINQSIRKYLWGKLWYFCFHHFEIYQNNFPLNYGLFFFLTWEIKSQQMTLMTLNSSRDVSKAGALRSSQLKDWTWVSCTEADSLPSEPPGKPYEKRNLIIFIVTKKESYFFL